ncbi:PREDICTED: protein HAIKU1 [Tarenaya hassleriana]|uniref:protein HAIKU1 n=1 Tax=Tarenaya hassleriana TaxID=28532 RepID=UPI00053C777A|nr:PREDICTED: protein HAIKU1 [Tarenaya hassleriana]XP_010530033.1 PREDICTED: protein HAIKU1 [Tarenaya hassleriana]
MDDARNHHHHHHHDHLGVNKMRRNIRKAPSQQQQQQQQQPQALVYNINKSDFRTIVQQLTGSGSTSTVVPPPENPPKPPNSRLVKVRPAPLTQVNRPPPPVQPGLSSPKPVQPHNPFQVNVAESPISAYMRYLTQPSPVQYPNPNGIPVQPHQTDPTCIKSPASQFIWPQPRSPLPLISPNIAFSPRILGGGPQSPSSSGLFFPLFSPTWTTH